jgi:hypothetical protein
MLTTKSNSYTFQKSGIWYFSRRIPQDLRQHYRTGRIAYSLRTKSIRDARVRAVSDAAKLDRHFLSEATTEATKSALDSLGY